MTPRRATPSPTNKPAAKRTTKPVARTATTRAKAPDARAGDLQTLSEQAADDILRRIATLELAPGTTFTERDLAARLGLGKVPVREALLRIASTGLVTSRTGSGYEVAPLTLYTTRMVFQAWRLVEPAALELAVRRNSPVLKTLREQLAHGQADDPALEEIRTHLGMVVLAANPYIMRSFPHVDLARCLALTRTLGHDAGCAPGAHDRLLDALEDGDPRIADLSREVIDEVEQRVVDALTSATALQAVNLSHG